MPDGHFIALMLFLHDMPPGRKDNRRVASRGGISTRLPKPLQRLSKVVATSDLHVSGLPRPLPYGQLSPQLAPGEPWIPLGLLRPHPKPPRPLLKVVATSVLRVSGLPRQLRQLSKVVATWMAVATYRLLSPLTLLNLQPTKQK